MSFEVKEVDDVIQQESSDLKNWGNKLKNRWCLDHEYHLFVYMDSSAFLVFQIYCQLLKVVISDFPGQMRGSDNTGLPFPHWHNGPGLLLSGTRADGTTLQVNTSHPTRLCPLFAVSSVPPRIWIFNHWERTLTIGPQDASIYYEVEPGNGFIVVVLIISLFFF